LQKWGIKPLFFFFSPFFLFQITPQVLSKRLWSRYLEKPQKKKPDSDTLALLQKLRKREQEKANSKKNKKRKR
jgi:hypothetical protein